MPNKPLVIYHSHCADGFSAAWAFWHRYRDSYRYHPAKYGELPPDVNGKDVYVVDFSYDRDILERLILPEVKSIAIIDHHKTAIENLILFQHSKLSLCLDDSKSGAMLAWEYLADTVDKIRYSVPLLLKYVQDRDLWKFELPGSKEVAMSLFSYAYDFETYENLMMNTPIPNLIAEGRAILRKFNKDLEELLPLTSRIAYLCGYAVPIANLPHFYASEGGMELAKNFAFAATYYDTPEHRVFSLRSTPEGIDVSQIASMYGGGGHKHASGFKVPRNHVLATI